LSISHRRIGDINYQPTRNNNALNGALSTAKLELLRIDAALIAGSYDRVRQTARRLVKVTGVRSSHSA
jgi:hypothetical protein